MIAVGPRTWAEEELTGTSRTPGAIAVGHRESSKPFSYYDDKDQVVGLKVAKLKISARLRFTTTVSVLRKRTGSSLFRCDRELPHSLAAFSPEFGSQPRSKLRGKLFLPTSEASCIAFGNLLSRHGHQTRPFSIQKVSLLYRKVALRYLKA